MTDRNMTWEHPHPVHLAVSPYQCINALLLFSKLLWTNYFFVIFCPLKHTTYPHTCSTCDVDVWFWLCIWCGSTNPRTSTKRTIEKLIGGLLYSQEDPIDHTQPVIFYKFCVTYSNIFDCGKVIRCNFSLLFCVYIFPNWNKKNPLCLGHKFYARL